MGSRIWASCGLLAVTAATLTACGSSRPANEPAAAHGIDVRITLAPSGCAPKPATVTAGPVTFRIANANADAVTEAEVRRGTTILGEKENLTPGLSGSFSLRLASGRYNVHCPGAQQADWTLTVRAAAAPSPVADPTLQSAVTGYHDYVVAQVGQLVATTKRFARAIERGDIAAAKTIYPQARTHYEAIEPVAESFGALDPEIDARVNDVASPNKWTGFHRIEKALWSDRSLAGLTPIAHKLLVDVGKLQRLARTTTFQPAQIANGAVELLDEVAKSKVTGEEERYSHTDLWDFAANVDGAQRAFTLLAPAVRARNAQLAATISAWFATVHAALAPYRHGAGYVDYRTVGPAERRVLAQKVNALAEPLSQVAALVVTG